MVHVIIVMDATKVIINVLVVHVQLQLIFYYKARELDKFLYHNGLETLRVGSIPHRSTLGQTV